MTPRERDQALRRRITEWAIEEECGKGKLPKTKDEIERVAYRLQHTISRAKIFHLDPKRHPKQAWFLKAHAPVVVAHTGNKFGKTFALLVRGLVASLGCAPWSPTHTSWYSPCPEYEPPIRVILVVQDYATSLPEDIIPRLKEIIPWDALVTRTSRVQGQIIDGIEFWNGTTWKILSHVQEDERFEGWSTHLCLWNEPMPQKKFIAADRGCIEFNARHLMSFTPISEPWLYDEIYLKAHLVRTQEDFDQIEVKKPEIVVVEGSIYDNKFLPEGAISRFEAKLSDEEKEARISGRWSHLSGRVYKTFDRDRHVRALEDMV